MKHFIRLFAVAVYSFAALFCNAQDEPAQLNLPGDNLNLYAVMKLFQESPTLETFEKKLNDESNKVNNLDLDGDNQIDYISVTDKVDGDIHNIALTVPINKDESQDVAVFVVKKSRNGDVQIQLVGDEALYGKDYIIEPNTGSSTPTPNPGYTGTTAPGYGETADLNSVDVQVSSWPMITYIYVPTYTVWHSPWHWGYYPSYWRPWTPFYWHEYYGYQYHWNYYYRAHYRYTPVYRFPAWHDRYYGGGFRSRSTIVVTRYNRGDYRQTYTRPELANRGADLFRRDHPAAPHADRPLPRFDNNNNNRPIVNRPRRDADRPGVANNNGNRDNFPNRTASPRPVDVNNPGNSSRPPDGNNRPNRPFPRNDNAGSANNNNNNTSNRPVTRPFNPGSDRNSTPDRPVVRPVTRPAYNTPNRPFNRPANPGRANRENPPNTPVNRPAGSNFPNRPVTTPAPPRPQQERQPAAQPAPERPVRERRVKE